MSGVSKGKSKRSKADPGQTETGPSIRVEETPHELSRFRHKVKEGLQNLFSIRSFHRRTASSRSVDIKDEPGEFFNSADREMRCVDRASEEAIVDTKDQSVKLPKSSKRQIQAMRTIGGGVVREDFQRLDKGKGRDNEGLDGVGGLAAMPGHPRQNYENHGTPEVDDRNRSRNQLPDIGGPSEQETTHVSPQGVASHFHGAHGFTIGGNPRFESVGVKNEYYCANHGVTHDIPILKEFVSFNAIHDSSAQDPTRRVHPGTRKTVLKRIRDWMDNPKASEPIFWLHGPAGIGKSAIAQTIAHSCARGKLAATFFFYRSDPGRNDGNRLFTSLAWQFAYSIPATKNPLIRSLIERPDICTKAVETQFEELIVKPFLELKRSGVQVSAPVVIIDGIDECSDDSLQRRFLKIIGNAVKDDRVPLRFLICSRPEAHIQDTMDIFQSLTLPLDIAKLDDANQDIEKYLKAEFSRIATEQGLDPAWPGEEIIQELVYKATGQFIYASTVIKYVGDEYSSAESQLDIIRGLKVSSISPFAELDELYKEILRRQRDPVFLKDFLSLFIGRNGTGQGGLQEDDAMLMNASEKELHRKLRGMRSLLKFEPYIDIYHRSFLDFLQDSSRSGQYHISKQAGSRRYLDLIAGALVRYASTVIERCNDHKTHFSPQFHKLSSRYPGKIVLPVDEWQEALQPLVDLQNKLLTLPNFRSPWEFLSCDECIGFHTMRDLLLHLAFILGTYDPVPNSTLMAESHTDRSEEMHSSVMSLIPIEIGVNTLEKDLNACLSSLLPRLRRRKPGVSPGTNTIQLACSLLHFDHAKIAMRLRSILDAQNLVDLIDELINNKYFCNDYIQDISRMAVHLALEIYARVPVLPRSLFLKGTLGPHHNIWRFPPASLPDTEVSTCLFCRLRDCFMSEVIVPDCIYVQNSRPQLHFSSVWMYKEAFFVANENQESLSQWRKRSKPSSITRIRVMLGVAKAIRYFHSMGIVLHDHVDSDKIFLDSQYHSRFRFSGLTARYVKVTPNPSLTQSLQSHEMNIFLFGCLFYEMCFGVKIGYIDRFQNNSNAVANRPSKPEIRDDEWQLIQRCCAEKGKSRPTMDDVVREMEAWDIS